MSMANEADEARTCWVCYGNESDDERHVEWKRPCRCRGATKWVHYHCLQRWVDEKQRGDTQAKVSCRVCNTEYIIIYPDSGYFLHAMEVVDRFVSTSSTLLVGGVILGSIYWTAVTYGAVTIMQVLGHKEGLNVMERADPVMLLVGLPAIPLCLILGKVIHWEDYILRMWRRYSRKVPFVGSLVSRDVPEWRLQHYPDSPITEPPYLPRVLCGALVFPTIATILGKVLFGQVNSNLQRTILGGAVFLLIKGAFKVYYLQSKFLRNCRRQINDYTGPG